MLTQQAVRDAATAAIGLVSLALLLRFKLKEPLLVLLATIAGFAIHHWDVGGQKVRNCRRYPFMGQAGRLR